MQADISIITASLCVALILTLSGCATIPPGTVKQAIEGRVHRQQESCPVPPQTIIIISSQRS